MNAGMPSYKIPRRLNWFISMFVAAFFSASVSQAHLVVYDVNLDGPSEAPPNASPGIGTATITFDLDTISMRIQTSFSGLIGNVTASHIHAAQVLNPNTTAGVATQLPSFTGFPLGGTSGTYDHTFDMSLASSYNPAYVTASGGTISQAFSALLDAADNNRAYLNIHTSFAPGGEIRGFLTAVPEPSSLMLSGLVGVTIIGRFRRRDLVERA